MKIVDPESNKVLWSETITGDLETAARRSGDVATAVAAEFGLSVQADQKARMARPLTMNAEALADYAQARLFWERGYVTENLLRAATLYKSALRKDPSFAAAWAGLADASWEAYLKIKDESLSRDALRAVAQALSLAPDDAAAHYSHARICRGTGRLDLAVPALRRAVTLQPANDDVHRLLGTALCEQGQVDAGLAELNEAVRLRPNYWRNLQSLGSEQYKAGRPADALSSFRRVSELQPDSTDGPFNVGFVEYTLGHDEAAVAAFTAALRIAQDSDVYWVLGSIHFEAGRCADAKAAFETAIKLKPDAEYHLNLGDLYAFMGKRSLARVQYETAVRLTEDALKVKPTRGTDIGLLGMLQAKLGNRSKALELAGQASDLENPGADALFRVAIIHALVGERQAAAEWLGRALSAGFSQTLAARHPDLVGITGAGSKPIRGGPSC